MAAGYLDDEGVWIHGEDDTYSTFSDRLNASSESISLVLKDHRERLEELEEVPIGWESFTPSFTGLTVGNATVVARHRSRDDEIEVYGWIIFGSTTAITGPVTIAHPGGASIDRRAWSAVGLCTYEDTGSATRQGLVVVESNGRVQLLSGNTLAQLSATSPHTWASGDVINFQYRMPR